MLVGLNNTNNLNHVQFVKQQNAASVGNKNLMTASFSPLSPLKADKFETKRNAKNNSFIYFGSNMPEKKFSVTAMAPLLIQNDIEMAKFNRDLQIGKANGVESISVDVWWGLSEKAGEGKFDWSYYEKVFSAIKRNGLKITPILSLHQCGGNVGDNVNIPIPAWTWDYLQNKKIAELKQNNDSIGFLNKLQNVRKEDLYYKNEHGQTISEVIPVWYDEMIMPKYRQFIEGFKEHFITDPNQTTNIKDRIDEIHISTGPAGELRYPTYGENLQGAEFPKRGWFVGYDDGGKASFRSFIEKNYDKNIQKLNNAWGTNLASFDEILPPHNNSVGEGRATGFVDAKDYKNTKYGNDFIDWYRGTLLKHGEDMLSNTHAIFKDTDIPVGIKIPGVHWQVANENTPRIAELIAGQIDNNISKEGDFGYKGFFDMIERVKKMFPKNDTATYFTCLEMDNDVWGSVNGNRTNSMAKTLVNNVLEAAKSRGLTIKGENACEECLSNGNAWNLLKENTWKGFEGITFLRLGSLTDNNHFKNFMNWVTTDLARKAKEVFRSAA